ncbi:MAG TPA: PRC-barrel domain-containing protein [Usitatibacter sp.]|jgi:sporulation protein YlmC with PRC-barrel domain|nr:PRC-barrel domain-containing protein [Usitatibacter sp.]
MIVSCTRLAGEAILDERGEEAGRIERVVIDLASGRVACVVLACGGVLGLGERQYTVPWSRLRLDSAHRRFILERTPERSDREAPHPV